MRYLIISLFCLCSFNTAYGQNIFPGAEGFGTNSRAAYSGSDNPKILKVNSLADTETGDEITGRGTLRWCLTRNYPRIIVFEVGGTINITEDIKVRNPYLTLYGQTAPFPGILLTGVGIDVRTHNVLIQHIAVRPGDDPEGTNPGGRDGLEVRNDAYNVVIDHCSMEWAIDENFSTWGENMRNITVSNCIIAEGLNYSIHPEGHHSKGLLVGVYTDSITLLKNYFAHNSDRNPYIQGGTTSEVINNLIYNGEDAIKFHDYETYPTISSVINNRVFSGYDYTKNYPVRIYNVSNDSKIYLKGNSDNVDDWSSIYDKNGIADIVMVSSPPISSGINNILSPEEVVDYIVENVGSRPWERDVVDQRIINSFLNRNGRIPDCVCDEEIYYPVGSVTNAELNKIFLDEIASEDDHAYERKYIEIIEGKGQGQRREIAIYNAANKEITITNNWDTIPDANSRYAIITICTNNSGGWFAYPSSGPELDLPSNPHDDDDSDGYTNIEEWAYEIGNPENQEETNNPPIIQNQEISVAGTIEEGMIIGTVQAFDPDQGQNLTYNIIDGNLNSQYSINSTTGDLILEKVITQNNTTISNLLIQVEDDANVRLSDTATITVKISAELNIIYIDPANKNDLSEDGSIGHPYDSWNDVKWKEGYSYLQKRGTTASENKINIESGNVIIGSYGDGDIPKINSSATDFAIRVYENSNITIINLHIYAPDAISCIYILGSSCDSNSVQNCILEASDYGIRIIDGKKVTIKYNTFNNKADGIYSYAEKTDIYYNIFKGNQIAINISSYISEADIYNNVFYNNREGISTSYASLTLYNNIFYLVDKGDLAIKHKMDKILSDYNIFYPEQEGFIYISDNKYSNLYSYKAAMGVDVHSFSNDPMFIDIYNENFNVLPQSPAIDAGVFVGLFEDYNGHDVPTGNAPDIGLFESSRDTADKLFKIKNENGKSITEPAVYPNPSNGQFNINLHNNEPGYSEVQIKDIAGKPVYQKHFSEYTNDIFVDISNVPSGIYFIYLSNAKDILSRMIIKN